ncbi:MAG: sigma-70 family RNA polymerase sigma factor [Catenulispora sp.]
MTPVAAVEAAATFDVFYAAAFHPCVARTARMLDGDVATAEDVVQDAMMALYDVWARVENKGGWLVTTCQRKVWKHWANRGHAPVTLQEDMSFPALDADPLEIVELRDELRRTAEELYPEELAIFSRIADGDSLTRIASAESSTVARIRATVRQAQRRLKNDPVDSDQTEADVLERYRSLLARLPSRQRQVMSLALSGVKPAAIASRLNISANSARVNLHHAKQALVQMPTAPPLHVLDALISTWRVRITTPQQLAAAIAGDQQAWTSLVEDHHELVWSIANGYKLTPEDTADICQTVWLQLIEILDRFQDPDEIVGWLATATRREALRMSRASRKVFPDSGALVGAIVEHGTPDVPDRSPTADPQTISTSNQDRADLWAAFSTLSEKHRRLLTILATTPEVTYAEVARRLGISVGSIGPTRQRALGALRRALDAQRSASDDSWPSVRSKGETTPAG